MTMQQRQPPPSFGYYLGLVPANRRTFVLDEIAEQAVSQFQTKLDAAWNALGLVRMPPRDRLAMYRQKPQAVWDEQRAKYPEDYAEDWKDYQDLRQRELDGDFA